MATRAWRLQKCRYEAPSRLGEDVEDDVPIVPGPRGRTLRRGGQELARRVGRMAELGPPLADLLMRGQEGYIVRSEADVPTLVEERRVDGRRGLRRRSARLRRVR